MVSGVEWSPEWILPIWSGLRSGYFLDGVVSGVDTSWMEWSPEWILPGWSGLRSGYFLYGVVSGVDTSWMEWSPGWILPGWSGLRSGYFLDGVVSGVDTSWMEWSPEWILPGWSGLRGGYFLYGVVSGVDTSWMEWSPEWILPGWSGLRGGYFLDGVVSGVDTSYMLWSPEWILPIFWHTWNMLPMCLIYPLYLPKKILQCWIICKYHLYFGHFEENKSSFWGQINLNMLAIYLTVLSIWPMGVSATPSATFLNLSPKLHIFTFLPPPLSSTLLCFEVINPNVHILIHFSLRGTPISGLIWDVLHQIPPHGSG